MSDMHIERRTGQVSYFTPWRSGRRSVGSEVRRIITVRAQAGSWAVIAVEHYRGGDTGDILHDEDYTTYEDALSALVELMTAAEAGGFITRADLERVPRPRTAPVRS
jgi:hypothetical protein